MPVKARVISVTRPYESFFHNSPIVPAPGY